MPLRLKPPKDGRSSVFRVRGTHRGVYLDRSTGTDVERRAEALRKKWERDIECGELTGKPELTFAAAIEAFVVSGREDRFIPPLLRHFGLKVLAKDIGQAAIDAAAAKIYPRATPATKSRQVHGPVSAILRHSGIALDLRRPKGAAGRRRTLWLTPAQFEAVYASATEADAELAIMMLLMVYTGMRLGEALALRCGDLNLDDGEAIIHRTKNGDPRVAYLVPRVVAALTQHPRGIDATDRRSVKNSRLRSDRVFRFTRNQALNEATHAIYQSVGVACGGAPFHVLRHTWATWMVRAGADLVATKAWRSQTAARNYTHFVVSEEARKADCLPGAKSVRKSGGKD